eukprot:TRINITY_DN2566_c0_g1_i1.p1 TRINITY_DN2566_c0_g1~~TRINITY_DN2566_c0_g1_i1.p1  ORF type:complete len:424 (+),score=34.57 TRINITY_DN2566_c0_g1_i1:86-1357(+)
MGIVNESRGKGGIVRVRIWEGRRLEEGAVTVTVEINNNIRATPPARGPDPVWNEEDGSMKIAVNSIHCGVYFKVIINNKVLLGRACVPLSCLKKESKHELWLALMPPSAGEGVSDKRGIPYRSVTPAVYQGGLTRTMWKNRDQPGYLKISAEWVDRPSLFDELLTPWACIPLPEEKLDWYGNLATLHVVRITNSLKLPFLLDMARTSSLSMKVLILSAWIMFVYSVSLWQIPICISVFFICNSLLYLSLKGEDTDDTDLIIFENDNPTPAPTIIETLKDCAAVPGALQTTQNALGLLASLLEKLAFVFSFHGHGRHELYISASVVLASSLISMLLYLVPVELIVIAAGVAFLASGSPPSTPPPETAASTTGNDSAVSQPASPLGHFVRNLWHAIPDQEEFTHRKISVMQRVNHKEVPLPKKNS